MKKSAKRTDVSRIFRTFAREKRASLLTLGHSSKLDGSRLIAALQPKSENIKNIEVYETLYFCVGFHILYPRCSQGVAKV